MLTNYQFKVMTILIDDLQIYLLTMHKT